MRKNNAMKSARVNRRRKRAQKLRSGPTNQVWGGPFPPAKVVTLRYSDVYPLVEAASGVGAYQQFRTADAYDPDYSGIGHQPLYFDQMCAAQGPYLTFACPKSTWRLKFVNNSTSVSALAVVWASMATLPLLSRTEAVEKPFAWTKIVAPLGSGSAVANTTYIVDNPKFVGVPYTTFLAQYTGNYGASAGGPFLNVVVYGIGGVADVSVEVQADIVTRFTQLGNIQTS